MYVYIANAVLLYMYYYEIVVIASLFARIYMYILLEMCNKPKQLHVKLYMSPVL